MVPFYMPQKQNLRYIEELHTGHFFGFSAQHELLVGTPVDRQAKAMWSLTHNPGPQWLVRSYIAESGWIETQPWQKKDMHAPD